MSEWISVAEIFGENVFNDAVMQERLPKKTYKELKKTIEEGKELQAATADVIAHEMKEWAIEKVPLTIRTGSSLLQEQQLKSMIRLFQHRSQMERS